MEGKPGPQEVSTLVIMSNTLADSELHRLLIMEHLKIKVSCSILPHTCLFPHSLVAFMILPVSNVLSSWPPTNRSEIHSQVSQNIERFSELHHQCYILLTAPLFGRHEQAVVSHLQDVFLDRDLQFVPQHNAKECMTCMQNITKVTCKPICEVIEQRMVALKKEIESEGSVLEILKRLGLTESESMMVLDGCGGLSGMAKTSYEDLMDLNLPTITVGKIMRLFHSRD